MTAIIIWWFMVIWIPGILLVFAAGWGHALYCRSRYTFRAWLVAAVWPVVAVSIVIYVILWGLWTLGLFVLAWTWARMGNKFFLR